MIVSGSAASGAARPGEPEGRSCRSREKPRKGSASAEEDSGTLIVPRRSSASLRVARVGDAPYSRFPLSGSDRR